jgi:magnesium chelatase family protein
VTAVQQIQAERYQKEAIQFNGELTGRQIEQYCRLAPAAEQLLQKAFDTIHFSARSYHRILKVSRTIADMEASSLIESRHVAEALSYRAFDKKYWSF